MDPPLSLKGSVTSQMPYLHVSAELVSRVSHSRSGGRNGGSRKSHALLQQTCHRMPE